MESRAPKPKPKPKKTTARQPSVPTPVRTGHGGGEDVAVGLESATTDPKLLLSASVLLADAALIAKQAGSEVTAALTDWRFPLRAARQPLWALGVVGSAVRALTNSAGLGFNAHGGLVGESARALAGVSGRRPAAIAMAVDAFAMRINAAAADNPNLDSPQARRLADAALAGRPWETLRAAAALAEHFGVTRALTTVSPVIMELLALASLLDQNTFNDDFAWVTLAGGVPTTDPFLGLSSSLIGWLNPGPGRAERAEPDAILTRVLARSSNDIVSYVDDIAALGNHGLALLRRVACQDGEVRYALLLPGTSFARLRNSTPQDVVGAMDGLLRTDTTYTRAVKQVLRRAGVPVGSALMVVGHSLGGITAMNLAMDVDFVATYRLTHVVTVGSPIDNKRPADGRTQVISLVNEHDVIPGLDGCGPASPTVIPEDWVELAWLDDAQDYPLSHAPQSYATALRESVPEYRRRVNDLIGVYDGTVVGNQLYRLRDR